MKKLIASLLSAGTLLFSASSFALDFSAHGYYRLRLEVNNNLDLQRSANIAQGKQGDNNRFATLFYGAQRFRLDPALKISDNISFHGQIDFLDDVIFGRSNTRQLKVANPLTGTTELPAATGAFGVTGGAGGDVVTGGGGNINVRRLYVDLLTPIGKFRLGRQPSHWGLGIFQNDGNDWDSLFGDTFDRFLYIGKVDFKNGSNLAFATLVDFAFQNNGIPAIDLLEKPITGSSHDTYQFTQALIYERPHLQVGTYAGLRFRNGTNGFINQARNDQGVLVPAGKDGDTRNYYIDGYFKWEKDPFKVQAEYVYIGGKIGTGFCIDAIDLRDTPGFSNPLPSPVCLNGSNNLSVHMGALEAEGKHGNEEWKLISGFAQGDSSPLSKKITQFGFRPDYHIGLMLFQEPLGTSPAIQVNGNTKLGNKPITSNFVNNAVYVGATYKHKFDLSRIMPQAQWIKVGAHVVTAWAPSRTIDLDFAQITGLSNLPRVVNNSKWYGVEADLIVEAKFLDHVFWNLTGGVFIPGGAFDIKNDDLSNAVLPPTNPINSIIFDKADPAFAVRSTLMLEF
ncbi:MAG: hypothetical protein JNK65_08795 [Deltaproteobacteria bacterium]|nr:hypothetical protein [Deltaproteobacteria bacterium]